MVVYAYTITNDSGCVFVSVREHEYVVIFSATVVFFFSNFLLIVSDEIMKPKGTANQK